MSADATASASVSPTQHGPTQLNARFLSDVRPTKVRWLWPGMLPAGKLVVLAGDPGQGKSLLAAKICAQVSTGGRWPDGGKCPRGYALFISAEDDPADTTLPRIMAAGGCPSRVGCADMIDENGRDRGFDLRDTQAIDQLIQTIKSTHRQRHEDWQAKQRRQADPFDVEDDKDPTGPEQIGPNQIGPPKLRLIVIDPVSAFMSGSDGHSNAEVRGMLKPLAELATRTGACVVLITHLSKGGTGKAVYRSMGSLAFMAAARVGLLLTKSPDDERRRLIVPVKNNLSGDQAGRAYTLTTNPTDPDTPVALLEPGEVDASHVLRRLDHEAFEDGPTKLEEMIDFVRDKLADGEIPGRVMHLALGEAGMSMATFRRACGTIGVRTRRGEGRQCFYSLPVEPD